MGNERREPTKTVLEMEQLNFSGNVIPHEWYEIFKTDAGKTDAIGILILAEICYWYRPTIVKDESSGKVIGKRRKFKADLLQRTYDSFADQFGFSKRQCTDAIIRLEKKGVIQRHLRTINTEGGVPVNNVLFIELFVDVLKKLTYPQEGIELSTGDEIAASVDTTDLRDPSHEISGQGTPPPTKFRDSPPTKFRDTYTEITYTENNKDKEEEEKGARVILDESTMKVNRFFQTNYPLKVQTPIASETFNQWLDVFPAEVIIHAMKTSLMQGATAPAYADRVLMNWQSDGVKTIEDAERAINEFESRKQQNQNKGKTNMRGVGHERNRESQNPGGPNVEVPDWLRASR